MISLFAIIIFLIHVICFITIFPVSVGTRKPRKLLTYSSPWLLTTLCGKQVKTLFYRWESRGSKLGMTSD